jgi:hypothetical protein
MVEDKKPRKLSELSDAEVLNERYTCSACLRGRHHECHVIKKKHSFTERKVLSETQCQCKRRGHRVGKGTCSEYTHSDSWQSHRCSKPAKGTWKIHEGHPREYEVELCGIHLAARRRRKATDEKHAAEFKAMREQWDREDAEARRADEVAPKLIAALNRHDIVRADKLVKAGRHGITVPAEIADRIADLLFEWADLVGES